MNDDAKNQILFHDNTFKDYNKEDNRYKDNSTSNNIIDLSENYYKSSEGLFASISFSLDYFTKKSPSEFSLKNVDQVNVLSNLSEENGKLKQELENYFYKYEKLKDKYSKLKQTNGSSQIQMENENYNKVKSH